MVICQTLEQPNRLSIDDVAVPLRVGWYAKGGSTALVQLSKVASTGSTAASEEKLHSSICWDSNVILLIYNWWSYGRSTAPHSLVHPTCRVKREKSTLSWLDRKRVRQIVCRFCCLGLLRLTFSPERDYPALPLPNQCSSFSPREVLYLHKLRPFLQATSTKELAL